MSALGVVELEREAKRSTRPPDRWIAWFVMRANEGIRVTSFWLRNIDTGKTYGIGEPFPDDANPRPTRESCEQFGLEQAERATRELQGAGVPVVCEFVEPVREGVSL